MAENVTVYPFGTDGHLPSSIGIINDLRTGGADKALSAEMGKEIGDFILPTEVFDLSEETEITAYISYQAPSWRTGDSNYKCKLVAVSAGDEFQLCGNGVNPFYYAALTDNSVSSGPSFAEGYSGPVKEESDACVRITMPTGASYLYLCTKVNGVDATPSVYKFRQSGAESLFLDMLRKQLWRKFPLYEYETLQAYIFGDGTWTIDSSDYSCKLIPVTEGEKYRITSSTKNCQFALLEDDTRPGLASFVESFNSVQILEAGSAIELTIPTGCTILYIAVKTKPSGYILPEKVEVLDTDSGSLLAAIKSLFPIANDYNGGIGRALSAEKGKELNEMASGYENIPLTSTQNAHLAINANEWKTGGSRRCLFIPVSAGDKFKIISSDDNRCDYAFVRDSAPVNNTKPEYAEGYIYPKTIMAGDEEILITAPDNATNLYVSIYNGEESVAPSAVKRLSKKSMLYDAVRLIDEYSQGRATQPSILKAGEPTNIIYTIDDFLMAHEYDENNNVDQFLFSNDLGETWSAPVVNRWGVLNNIFMFADGTLIFAGYKEEEGSKWYWTRDFKTFNDCTVIDYNGAYVPEAGVRRFGEIQAKTHHVYVNGEEYYCFGDYIIKAGAPRIWYALSDASGVTIRSAFAFSIQRIDGSVIYARHYHSFDYNPYDGKFYALTGDSTNQCNILRGTHDENHVWTWERVAYGDEYKLASISFDAGNMYAITDYTASTLKDKKGLLSVPINDIRAERFRYWFNPSSEFMEIGNGAALSATIVDNHGWRVIGLDYAGNSKLLIAKGGHNFVWVDNDAGVKMKGWIGPNNNGDVYVWWYTPGFETGNDDWVKYSHRTTYNFTAMMRKSGATDFFDGWVGTPK